MKSWFLIYCKALQDAKAEKNLLRQGYKVFRPTILATKSKTGQKDCHIFESLFPRYLFVNVDPNIQSIAPILSTYGVARFVKFGDSYAYASDYLINKIKTDVERISRQKETSNLLREGEEILVQGHGFDQVKAIFSNSCGDQRAMILMDILGKQSRLTVPMECLSRVASFV
jgi:transcriptional antiterminator RfaH